ncbi:MAG: hypothetical protein Fur005_02720 [Roseiflexaceae bacterium]
MVMLESPTLHIRFAGRSEELCLADLELTNAATDTEILKALARRYGTPPHVLKEYLVVREPQAIIVRPVAIYG